MADAKLEQKLERLLDRLEILLPKTEDEVDWSVAAFRWRRKQYLGMSYGVLAVSYTHLTLPTILRV